MCIYTIHIISQIIVHVKSYFHPCLNALYSPHSTLTCSAVCLLWPYFRKLPLLAISLNYYHHCSRSLVWDTHTLTIIYRTHLFLQQKAASGVDISGRAFLTYVLSCLSSSLSASSSSSLGRLWHNRDH